MTDKNSTYMYLCCRKPLAALLLASTALLSGCASVISEGSYISESVSNVALKTQYNNPADKLVQPTGEPASPIIAKDGLNQSNNLPLRREITKALNNHPNIKIQQANVEQARQQLIISTADQGLNLSLNNSNSIRTNSTSSVPTNNFDLAVQGSWKIDLWGDLSAQSKIAQLQLNQSLINLQDSQHALVADITKAWYQLAYYQALLSLTSDQEKNTQDQLAAIESSYQRGLSESLDVYLARSNYQSAQSSTLVSANNKSAASRKLEQLLSKYPSGKLTLNANLSLLDNNYEAGIPADLLKNRADLRLRLQAVLIEDASVAASYAKQFPQFSLTGNLSLSATRLTELFSQNIAWSLISTLNQTLFDNGKQTAQYRQAKAKLLVAEQQYLQTLQSAITEVENLLDGEKSIQQRKLRNQLTLKNSQLSYEQVQIQYQNGIANYQQVLNVQQQLFNHQKAQLDLNMQQLENRINLIQALGIAPAPKAIQKPTPTSATLTETK